MNDTLNLHPPAVLQSLVAATRAMGFTMASDELTGSLLRTLAATKPAGNLLELGTGTGLATAWMLDGMDAQSTLHTVDQDESLVAVAQKYLASDSRVTFAAMDGAAFIESLLVQQKTFDLIFADTWPGKFWLLEETLSLLKIGGLYVIDDLLPQPNWPEEHPPKVAQLIAALEQRPDLRLTKLNWSTGLILAVRTH
ncbi:MAG: methyltransferase domain-containing protein [Acidobacteria bacterium]|nr:methyltransferase domain-containing protein [Acidobacteriota bacterium]